jgi:hypothetical protein
MFALDQLYTRREIHDKVGGSIRHMLPTRAGRVVACCTRKEMDPLLRECHLLIGDFKQKLPAATHWVDGEYPVPLFRRDDSTGKWRYCGEFRARRRRSDAAEVLQFMEKSGDPFVALVLDLEPVGPKSGVVPICCAEEKLGWKEAIEGPQPTENEIAEVLLLFRKQGAIPRPKVPRENGFLLLERMGTPFLVIVKAARESLQSVELTNVDLAAIEEDPRQILIAIVLRTQYRGTVILRLHRESSNQWQSSDSSSWVVTRMPNGAVRLRRHPWPTTER